MGTGAGTLDTAYTIIYNKKYFSDDHFSYYYSLCPNLEGIKDALFYKFRRPMIGQNCSAVCTNKGGHRDAFLNERREALCVSRFERPAQHALVVDSTFDQNENVAIA